MIGREEYYTLLDCSDYIFISGPFGAEHTFICERSSSHITTTMATSGSMLHRNNSKSYSNDHVVMTTRVGSREMQFPLLCPEGDMLNTSIEQVKGFFVSH